MILTKSAQFVLWFSSRTHEIKINSQKKKKKELISNIYSLSSPRTVTNWLILSWDFSTVFSPNNINKQFIGSGLYRMWKWMKAKNSHFLRHNYFFVKRMRCQHALCALWSFCHKIITSLLFRVFFSFDFLSHSHVIRFWPKHTAMLKAPSSTDRHSERRFSYHVY